MKVLCTGDIHIGRRSSRIPQDLDISDDYSTAKMWTSIVNLAVSEKVNLVALSGDIVDKRNRFFEAIGPLEKGIRELSSHGIPTFAVCGNHDFDVLESVQNTIGCDYFHVLGSDSTWEKRILMDDKGNPLLQIIGKSFSNTNVAKDPFDDFDLLIDPNIPSLGIIHGELDVKDSKYCPIMSDKLQTYGTTLWLLGHIHKPMLHTSGNQVILNPGSPLALDPGERGGHGPWIANFKNANSVEVDHRRISKVRYENCTIDMSKVNEESTLKKIVFDSLQSLTKEVADNQSPCFLVLCRLVLEGQTELHHILPRFCSEIREQIQIEHKGVQLRVESTYILTRPSIHLESWVGQKSQAGALARTILELQKNELTSEVKSFVKEVQLNLMEIHNHRNFNSICDDLVPDECVAKEFLIRQGFDL